MAARPGAVGESGSACTDDVLAHRVGDAEVVRDGFDELPMPVALLQGPEHRFVGANAAYRRMTGRDDLIGSAVREAFPELATQQLFELIERVYTSGESVTGREWRLQMDRGDGVLQEVYLDFVVLPRRRPDGAVHGLLVQHADVTERVQQRHAAQAAAAEAQQRYQAARDVVVELQQALLPTVLPVLPDVQTGARYLVAASDQAAGGDWFDALPLADGRLVLVVGDVVGHGVAASAAMGQLRAVLKQLLTTCPDLASALAQADAFAASEPALRAATLAVVVIEPATGQLRYSLCGHPPPLLVRTDGSTAFLAGPTTGALGVGRTPTVAASRLEPGELVLLYSDGLIERPHRTLSEGAAELAAVAADAVANRVLPASAAVSPAERVCQLTVELLTRTGYSDDVTALAAQRLPHPVAPLSVELPAVVAGCHAAVSATRAWLSGVGAGNDDRHALVTAVGEAVTNAAEHAYQTDPRGAVLLTADLRPDGVCEFRISDQGRWRTTDSGDTQRGRGLLMCDRLVDELTVTHPPQQAAEPPGARGTTVTLRHRIHRPVMLASDPGAVAGHLDTDRSFGTELFTTGDPPHLRVCGPVDIATAERFTRDISAASRGGTRSVQLELSGVTHLASAGVRALYEASEQLAAHQQRLELLAAPRSPAALVLELVSLPHTAPEP